MQVIGKSNSVLCHFCEAFETERLFILAYHTEIEFALYGPFDAGALKKTKANQAIYEVFDAHNIHGVNS